MNDFNRKRHAVYKLTYHAVFVIKYRRKVMSEPIIEHMRQYEMCIRDSTRPYDILLSALRAAVPISQYTLFLWFVL